MNNLEKQAEELNQQIETWKEYQNSHKKYYNIPLPEELLDEECKFYNDRIKEDLDEWKIELAYLKEISKIYDEYDFIVTEKYHNGNFKDINEIKMVQITPEVRKELKNVCIEHEEIIKLKENSSKNE